MSDYNIYKNKSFINSNNILNINNTNSNCISNQILLESILNIELNNLPSRKINKLNSSLKFLNLEYLNNFYNNNYVFPLTTKNIIYKYLFKITNNIDEYSKLLNLYNQDKIICNSNNNDNYNDNDNENISKHCTSIDNNNSVDKRINNMINVLKFFNCKLEPIHFLKDYIYQFIKYIKLEEHYLFEIILSFLNFYGNYWFLHYPSPPIIHMNYIEDIINNELNNVKEAVLFNVYLKDDMCNLSNYNINVIHYLYSNNALKYKYTLTLWRLHYSLFRDIFSKEQFLCFIDFCSINFANNKSYALLYFTASIFILLVKECSLNLNKINILKMQTCSNMSNNNINSIGNINKYKENNVNISLFDYNTLHQLLSINNNILKKDKLNSKVITQFRLKGIEIIKRAVILTNKLIKKHHNHNKHIFLINEYFKYNDQNIQDITCIFDKYKTINSFIPNDFLSTTKNIRNYLKKEGCYNIDYFNKKHDYYGDFYNNETENYCEDHHVGIYAKLNKNKELKRDINNTIHNLNKNYYNKINILDKCNKEIEFNKLNLEKEYYSHNIQNDKKKNINKLYNTLSKIGKDELLELTGFNNDINHIMSKHKIELENLYNKLLSDNNINNKDLIETDRINNAFIEELKDLNNIKNKCNLLNDNKIYEINMLNNNI